MTVDANKTIYPCPISKGYGIPFKQAWILLKVYYLYRFILACSITLLFYFRLETFSVGTFDIRLYHYTSLVYLILTVLLGLNIFWRNLSYSKISQIMVLSDIILLTVLMFASGGIKSGIGVLLAVSVAAGGLLVGGGCAVVFAAVASLTVLTEELYASEYLGITNANYPYAGMLGATYFAIALLSTVLAKRSEQMLQLTDQQQHTILQLEELNQYIIQHLQSGIVITNSGKSIQMVNQATLKLANMDKMPISLDEISDELGIRFQDWLLLPDNNVVMIKLSGDSEIQCRFLALPAHQENYYMIILEDIVLYNQRLQQSKLASLGRLTASIAHEIRNPLGAICHAVQLLSESTDLVGQDIRFANIIQSNSSRVNQIIEDILNLSRRSDSSKEKIQLANWLTSYLQNYTIEYSVLERTFELISSEEALWGFIDPAHLKQIMDNLCQNALRYGLPERGPIKIVLGHEAYGPCIEVIDNGSGISAENQKQLFEPFFTTSLKGTGLGLYISRELAELNQAKLSYSLKEGRQSCFSLCVRDANQTTIEL